MEVFAKDRRESGVSKEKVEGREFRKDSCWSSAISLEWFRDAWGIGGYLGMVFWGRWVVFGEIKQRIDISFILFIYSGT